MGEVGGGGAIAVEDLSKTTFLGCAGGLAEGRALREDAEEGSACLARGGWRWDCWWDGWEFGPGEADSEKECFRLVELPGLLMNKSVSMASCSRTFLCGELMMGLVLAGVECMEGESEWESMVGV